MERATFLCLFLALAFDPVPAPAGGDTTTDGHCGLAIAEFPSNDSDVRELKILVAERTFKKDPSGALRISLGDLNLRRVLNIDSIPENVRERMPAWLRDLDGKRIRVRGRMISEEERENTSFLLEHSTVCVHGFLRKDRLIPVTLKQGRVADYAETIEVIGTLHIAPVLLDGLLYRIDEAVVVEED